MNTLVDTNVLVDVVTNDPVWGMWSLQQLENAGARGALAVNPIIYAELSAGYGSTAEVDDKLERLDLSVADLPKQALFQAGQAFRHYRTQGGPRLSLLPDFLIGAHAAVEGWPLLTRDVRRYRSYFPKLQLITP